MLTDEEIMAQVLDAFKEEEAEHRQAITDILLEVEREPNHPQRRDLIDQLFREAHSLKGGARAAGQEAVEQLSHKMEDVFSAVRAGKIQLDPDVCDTIYAAVDAIGGLMAQVHAGQTPSLEPHQQTLDNLAHVLTDRLQHQQPDVADAAPALQATEPTSPEIPEQAAAPPVVQEPAKPELLVDKPAVDVHSAPDILTPQQETHHSGILPSLPAVSRPVSSQEYQVPVAEHSPQSTSDIASATSTADSANYLQHAQETDQPLAPTEATGLGQPLGSSEMPWDQITTVRLSTTTLDSLLNETGELITSAVRAQQRAVESRTLADLPLRWRRIWRHVRPVIARLQSYTPAALQPTVHHLNDRVEDIKLIERAARVVELSGSHQKDTSVTSQLAILIDALNQANTLITELEQKLSLHARQTTEDHTRLATVTDRLHDQIRHTRMLPLSTLFSPLRVQLRDVVRAAGKQVELHLDDGGAEADRQVLERLREVLLHLLRNSVDHGIESPNLRTARNKTPTGHIWLRSAVSGDYLTINVEDDGAGLDISAIRQRAISGGLLSEMDLTRITESELMDLIFLPGFSTRQIVSKMSGRGVGLDVVRSQVERMQGRVTVQSFQGTGCVFTISVPLSLTSSHGLLLRIDQATYMLPLDSVQRIVSVAPSDIKVLEGRSCLMIDNRPLALVHLSDLLGKSDRQIGKEERRRIKGFDNDMSGRVTGISGWSLALLLGSGERQVACMVDAVLGEQELVVYRLPAPLLRVRFIAGATILADGSVVPILDVVDLVRSAIGSRYSISQSPEIAAPTRPPTVLVVDDSITTRTLEKNILEAAGYKVSLATDGVEALDTLRRMIENEGCDLLLSDIDMPRLNGFELTSQVRADTHMKHIPIVLVTSLDTPADRERGIAAGADAYIVKKAFDQQFLLDTIEQLI